MNINHQWNLQYRVGPRLIMLLTLLVSPLFFLEGNVPPTLPSAGTNLIRVATTGLDISACGSAETPCKTIQYAESLASSGDTILVGKGTYTYAPSGLWPTCYGASITPPVVCIIDKNLTLLGGYDGQNWSFADPVANPTIIDGQSQYRGIGLFGSSATTPNASLYMEGFTVVNGLALGATQGADYEIAGYGGGMFATNAPITLRKVVFAGNHATGGNTNSSYGGAGVGGGLAINATPPGTLNTLDNVTFDSNQALGGSGINRGGGSLGGGFYIYSARVNATNIILQDNIAQGGTSSGSGADGTGLTADALGGAGVAHGDSDVTLQYVTATGNRAVGGNAGGQAGHGDGGALFAEYATMMMVYDSNIQANVSLGGNGQYGGIGGGGGIMATNSNIVIERTKIIANTATGGAGTVLRGSAGGGGIYLTRFSGNTSAVIVNSMIADNYIAMGSGPGNPGGGGGGLWLQGIPIDIVHTTIAHNRMESGLAYGIAAIFVDFGAPTPTVANISYSAITDHSNTNPNPGLVQSTLHVWSGNTINLNKGVFANNSNNTNLENDPSSTGGPGTINGLATMQSLSMNYVSIGSPFYNYHIASTSSAINQASGSTTWVDIDGQFRPFNGVSDIGADEYLPFPLTVVPGDQRLSLNWNKAGQYLAGGVNKYSILVSCETGANPPNEVGCNSSVDVGSGITSYLLTGLTNFKHYTLSVSAKTSLSVIIGTSESVIAMPTDILIYLPIVFK